MSRIRTLAVWFAFSGITLPGAADALICETLGPAARRWNFVSTDKIVTKRRYPYEGVYYYGCSSWGFTGPDVASCSGSARYFQAYLDSITTTASRGTAVSFKDGGEYECGPTSNVDEVFTGGGAAKLSKVAEPDTVDASGTHPAVAGCTDAIAEVRAASAAFAAMTPIRTYDRIRIVPGEEFVIDATGGGVINIGELKMLPVAITPLSGSPVGTCIYNAEDNGAAVLRITGSYTDEVVLNVGKLDIGGCAQLYSDPWLLINVPGPGRKVSIGISAFYTGFPPDILAPERTVRVTGGRTNSGTQIGGMYARKLIALGYVYTSDPYCLTCGIGGVDSNEACDGNLGCPAGTGLHCDDTCSSCTTIICGDGIAAGTDETCDGSDECPTENGLYCNNTCSECSRTICGDGIRAGAEPCDGADGCTAPEICRSGCQGCTTCGNGVVDGTETCDGALGCPVGMACNSTCTACRSICGDGIIGGSEVCDRQGNVGCPTPGLSCNSTCTACQSVCGDGTIAGSEVCDRQGNVGCPTPGLSCNSTCTACQSVCGDGIIGGSEVCDRQGNVGCTPGLSCNSTCAACEPVCGDGTIAGSEVCDRQGNVGCTSGLSCNSTCTACQIVCGDNVVGGSETCDGSDGCAAETLCNGTCSACLACPPASVILPEGGTFSGTTTGGSKLTSTCGGGGTGPERTFEWTPAVSGIATLGLCGSSYDTVLYIRQGGCGGPTLGCNDDSCGYQSRLTPSVVAGQTYTIVVDGYGGASGSFVLNVTPPAP